MGDKINCIGCKWRCMTEKQFFEKPYKNMWGEIVGWNCLVTDQEIDETETHPCCYEPREKKEK